MAGIAELVKLFSNPFQASAYVIFFPFVPNPAPLPMKVYFPTQLNIFNLSEEIKVANLTKKIQYNNGKVFLTGIYYLF